jgi:hypothetical protein
MFKIIYSSIEISNEITLSYPRYLNNNQITDINPQAFQDLSALKRLQITQIHATITLKMTLKNCWMSFNRHHIRRVW